MKKSDAKEATKIVERLAANLAQIIPPRGRPGSDARAAVGDLKANAYMWLVKDELGPPLVNAFDATRSSGCTIGQMNWVRDELMLEQPKSLGAVLVMNSSVNICLATCGMIIANMAFISRTDVEAVKYKVNQAFADPEEVSADNMDSAVFQALISLHAAITNHLVTTARPLPKLVDYRFARVFSTLVLAHRLYGDASRADEIRAENKIVHPAFAPLIGIALSR